jgi:hypothetical protein
MTDLPIKTRVALDLADDDDDMGLNLSAFKPRSAPIGSGTAVTAQQALRDASEKQGFHARPEVPVAPVARPKAVKAKPVVIEPIVRRRTRKQAVGYISLTSNSPATPSSMIMIWPIPAAGS